MADGISPPPSVQEQPDITQNADTKGDKWRAFANALAGGGAPMLRQSVEEHHQRQLAEMDMHQKNMQTLAGLLAKANHTGIDPTTGQAVTEETKKQWQAQMAAAQGAWGKLAGRDKNSKGIVQKMTGVIQHLAGGGPPQAQQTQAQPQAGPPPAMQESLGIPALGEMAQQQAGLDQKMAQERGAATVKGEQAVAAPSQMIEGLKKAGFSEEEAKGMVAAKTQGKAGRPDKPHWVVVTDPKDQTSHIPAWQDPTSHKVYDADNNEIEHAHILQPGLLPTAGTTEQIGFDAKGNPVAIPLRRTSQKAIPGAKGTQSATQPSGKAGNAAPAPPKTTTTGGSTQQPSLGRKLGDVYPARQFGIFSTPAQGAKVALQSIVGEKPYDEPGGLMQDLAIFDNPDSIRRVTAYLNFFDKALSLTSKAADAQGPMAAAEWWSGLPTTLSNMQAQAAQEIGETLRPAEEDYIADRYRVLGTISGLRKSTGAPAAEWSFGNMQREVPTPGPTMTRRMAERQVLNLVKEVNSFHELNHLIPYTDLDKIKTGGKQRFMVGSQPYEIPADKVEAFRKKYPNAVAQ